MKTIEHITDIAAPVEVVWDALTDVESYPDWNPFLAMDHTPTGVGDRVTVTVRPGKRTMTFRPTITVFESRREISWLGRFHLPGLCDGAHTLALEPLPDGRTRFRHREVFRGALVPFMASVFRDTDAGFAAMNAALATRLEIHTPTVTLATPGLSEDECGGQACCTTADNTTS